MSSQPVQFLLNGEPVVLVRADPNQTVLQFLREKANLKGTKEGCAEGDCGACMVAVAQIDGQAGLHWRAVNSCIRLTSSLDGKAVLTVDGLLQPDGALHPVQQAMVDAHGSQCGFCTPGFVMSMVARFQNGNIAELTRRELEDLLSGNLCRCTGYRPIVDAALALRHVTDRTVAEQNQTTAKRLADWSATRKTGDKDVALRPATITELLQLRAAHPDAQLIAGCTDTGLWITKQHCRFQRTLDVTFVSELQTVTRRADGGLRIGAAAPLTRAWDALVGDWPSLTVYAARFASLPIRNSGTLGGNIANGSPIGDSMPVLMALGTTLTVASTRGERQLSLDSFYRDRQRTVMDNDEVLLWIDVPAPVAANLVAAYKVSKRFDQDISAVCIGLNLSFTDHRDMPTISSARIGVGGMAATPMRATKTERVLTNAAWREATIDLAAKTIRTEFSPITDMRASDAYRRHVIGALLIRAWRQAAGQLVALESMT